MSACKHLVLHGEWRPQLTIPCASLPSRPLLCRLYGPPIVFPERLSIKFYRHLNVPCRAILTMAGFLGFWAPRASLGLQAGAAVSPGWPGRKESAGRQHVPQVRLVLQEALVNRGGCTASL